MRHNKRLRVSVHSLKVSVPPSLPPSAKGVMETGVGKGVGKGVGGACIKEAAQLITLTQDPAVV